MASLLYSLRDVAVAACDPEMKLVAYSPGFREVLGHDVPGELGQISEFLAAYDGETDRLLEVPDWPLSRALRGEVVRDCVIRVVRGDGSQVYLRCNASPRRDADDSITGALLLVQDVTEAHFRHRREEELRARLIKTINHEFRTPLSLVLGHAELLDEMRLDLPPEAHRFLDAIVDGACRLHGLTQAVSELVDLEAAGEVDLRDGDLCECVRDEIELLRRLADSRRVVVTATVPVTLPVHADLGLVGRAVAALLRNAVEHSPAGAAIEVAVRRNADRAVVEIRDSGPGIAPADVARLCAPFETGDPAAGAPTTRGLGLALARTVALAHHGQLRLEPNTPTGLRASLEIPLPREEVGEVA